MFWRNMYVHVAVLFVASALPLLKVNHDDEPESEVVRDLQRQVFNFETNEMGTNDDLFKHGSFQPKLAKNILADRLKKRRKVLLSKKEHAFEKGIKHLIIFKNNTHSENRNDEPEVGGEEDLPEPIQTSSDVECRRINGYKDTGLIVVRTCPISWKNDRIQNLCFSELEMQNRKTNTYDLNSLPVQSDNGIIYKNRYCGICNNASNPKSWDIHFICVEPTRLVFQSGRSTVKVMEDFHDKSVCSLDVKPPYQQPLETCLLRSKRNTRQEWSHSKNTDINVDPISFSLLMNFGFDGKTHVMFSTKDEMKETKRQPRCKENEIFDPDKDVCRHVSCSNGYSLKDETCINDGKTAVYNDTDIENIKDVNTLTRNNRIARVSLEVNVTYDELGFVIYALEFKPAIIKKLANILNITSERIQNFTISFLNESEASGKNIRVETMTKDEYEKQNKNTEDTITLETDDDVKDFADDVYGDDIEFDYNKTDPGYSIAELIEDNENSTSTNLSSAANSTLIVHREHRILNPQILQLSFILLPSKSDDCTESVSHIINKMNMLMKEKTFKFNMNGTIFNIVAVEKTVPEQPKTFCKFGLKKVYFDNEFDLVKVLNTEDNSTVTRVYVPSTESLYGPGDYDMTVLLEGKLGTKSNLTGVAGYAFVCINARNLNYDCAKIKISSDEYVIFENKTIRFNDQNYNILQYSILDEIRGDLEICVPDEYYKHEKLRRRQHWFVQGCHNGFSEFTIAEGYITAIVGRLSMFALCFVLITYCLFRTLRNLPGINTMNLTLALLLGETMFIEGETSATPWLCAFVAISVHYFFLASFFWMNVMSFDVYKTFANKCILTRVRSTRKFIPRYAAYAWGSPAIIVSMCIFIEYSKAFGSLSIGYGRDTVEDDVENATEMLNNTNSNTTDNSSTQNNSGCWIRSPVAALTAFGLPVMLIFIVNTIFFVKTIICIQATAKLAHHTTRRTFSHMTGKSDVMLYVRMSTVMGFTWVFGIASSIISAVFTKPDQSVCMSLRILSILFTVLNCGQGLFIFFAFVFKRRVFYLYRGLFKRIKTFIAKRRFKKLYATSSNSIPTVSSRVSTKPD